MDHDDSTALLSRGIPPNDPLPPENHARSRTCGRTAAVYREERPRLARFLQTRAPTQDVADLIHECFRRLMASSAYPRVLTEQPGAYLFRTARNLLAERGRADHRHMAAHHTNLEEHEIAGTDPHAALEARDEMRRVGEALGRLKPKTRDIFLMHRVDGLSYEEIAAAMGMSVKGVEKQIAKALRAIRRARTRRP